jgi:flagellar motor switch/type III secretory pathway protein FliN
VTAVLAPYPWELLERIPKRAVREARRVRVRVEDALTISALEAALSSVLRCHVMIVVRTLSPADTFPADDAAVHVAAADRSLVAALEPEPALTTTVLERVLQRAPGLPRLDARLDPATQGALAAIVVEVARRANASVPLRGAPAAPPRGEGLRVESTVFLDDRPYALTTWVRDVRAPTAGAARSAGLSALGGLPIELCLVAAASVGTRADLSSLSPGDVWLSPRPPWAPRSDAGAPLQVLLLSAPNAEQGVLVERFEEGRIVLRGDPVALRADAPAAAVSAEGAAIPTDMTHPEDTLQRIAVDAPVVVRVEVGTVTLSAREWAELRPGDVVETGTRLAEPVVLRVAGREVARGELVSVDGELGVRIREIVPPPRGP